MLDRRTQARLAQVAAADDANRWLTASESAWLAMVAVRDSGTTLVELVEAAATGVPSGVRPATGPRADRLRRRATVRKRLRLPVRSCLARRHHEACHCGNATVDALDDSEVDRLE